MLRKLLDRPIAVTMIAVVLLILGIVSSRLLPVSLVPAVYHGADPRAGTFGPAAG